MHSRFSTRSLLIALATLIVAVCVYLLFSALNGGGARGGRTGNLRPITVEQKAAVLHALSQTSSSPSAETTNAETKAQLRAIQNVSRSSGSASPSETQSNAAKLKVLNSLNSQ